jgi:hypothetical protein
MATINNTQYDEIELTIQRQVDRLNHSLWSSTISPEALEQKLAQRRFSEAEKTCIRYAFRAVSLDDYEAGEALEAEWAGVYDDEISDAMDAALDEAVKTGDDRRATRLHELSRMADTCIEVALCNALH